MWPSIAGRLRVPENGANMTHSRTSPARPACAGTSTAARTARAIRACAKLIPDHAWINRCRVVCARRRPTATAARRASVGGAARSRSRSTRTLRRLTIRMSTLDARRAAGRNVGQRVRGLSPSRWNVLELQLDDHEIGGLSRFGRCRVGNQARWTPIYVRRGRSVRERVRWLLSCDL